LFSHQRSSVVAGKLSFIGVLIVEGTEADIALAKSEAKMLAPPPDAHIEYRIYSYQGLLEKYGFPASNETPDQSPTT
jgi:hypothetical protein